MIFVSKRKVHTMNEHVACKSKNDTTPGVNQVRERLRVPGSGGYEVEWDLAASVTPIGTLVFFAQYLAAGGLFDALCADSPLHYTSPNAPAGRDVLGTLIVSILNGQTRYAHMEALRGDRVSADIFQLAKFVSEDSVRRALRRGTERAWDAWLSRHERAVWEPLLVEPYVLDIDNTVKSLYGHQEGAEKGYNPQKHGRPSHNYHTYFVGSLRLVLGVDVHPGKEHSGGHGMPGLWRLLDSLPAHCRPRLLRGDVSYGNEKGMVEAERRSQPYLFKLRQTTKVRNQIEELERTSGAWHDLADGWQGTETLLMLAGWTHERRCVFLRRPAAARPTSAQKNPPPQTEFTFVQVLETGPHYEYMVLVTNTDYEREAVAQLYRDRADCENVFDEIKNQWGWAGYVTRDLRRCRIVARLIALVYNWWNIFTRLAQRDRHLEAITSRPLLLHAVGRLLHSGRRKILRLTSTHACAEKVRDVLNRIARFLNRLTAEQLTPAATWAFILTTAFSVWLRGKPLRPIAEGHQFVLNLPI
jgi:hypothetical protein